VREERAPRGFDAPGALTFHVSLRGENYAKPEQQQRYFNSLLEQLCWCRVTARSRSAAACRSRFDWRVRDRQHRRAAARAQIRHLRNDTRRSPELLSRAGHAPPHGTPFDSHDDPASTNVAILNRNAATELFGAEDPLGKVLDFVAQPHRGVPPQPSVQIVGVVENAQEFGANEVPQVGLYVPFAQRPLPSAYVLVSSDVPRGALLGPIRDAAYSLDKDQPFLISRPWTTVLQTPFAVRASI